MAGVPVGDCHASAFTYWIRLFDLSTSRCLPAQCRASRRVQTDLKAGAKAEASNRAEAENDASQGIHALDLNKPFEKLPANDSRPG